MQNQPQNPKTSSKGSMQDKKSKSSSQMEQPPEKASKDGGSCGC